MAPRCPSPPGDPQTFSDALTAPSGTALLPSILAQTPRGAAWRTDENHDPTDDSVQHRFWRAVADPVADLYAKLWNLALASTACTLSGPEDPSNDALDDWEADWGLPDPCLGNAVLPVEQRKRILRAKIADLGGQSIAYFICLAASIGYTITISEYRPFRCGAGRCGASQIGAPFNEVIWQVFVDSPAITWFRLGAGRTGKDPLGSFGRHPDLECLLNEWKPAHTQIRFHYVYTGATKYPFAPGLS